MFVGGEKALETITKKFMSGAECGRAFVRAQVTRGLGFIFVVNITSKLSLTCKYIQLPLPSPHSPRLPTQERAPENVLLYYAEKYLLRGVEDCILHKT